MPLEKATKEILLYGGHDNDKADHLQSQPNVAYTQNAHWRNKEGVLQKRLGLKESTATGAPSSNLTPAFMHPIGDKLYTFVDNKAYAYDVEEDTWDSQDSVPFFVKAEKFDSSARGELTGYAFYYCKSQLNTANNDHKVLAYSLSEDETTIVQFGPDDTVISTNVVDGSFPQIVPAGTGPVVFTCNASGTLGGYNTVPSAGTVSARVNISTDVYTGRLPDDGSGGPVGVLDNASGFPWFVVSDPVDTTDYHQGQSGTKNYIAYCEAGDTNLHVFNLYSGNEFVLTHLRDYHIPLGLFHADTAGRFYLVANSFGTGASYITVNGTSVFEYAVDTTGTDPAPLDSADMTPGGAPTNMPTPTRATGFHDSANSQVVIAVNTCRTSFASTSAVACRMYRFSDTLASGTLTEYSSTPSIPYWTDTDGYRFTAPMLAVDPDGSAERILMPLQLQPFQNMMFAQADDGGSPQTNDAQDSFTNWRFPTTTVVSDITDIFGVSAVASVDTSQSRLSDFDSIFNGHLGTMCYGPDANSIYITNREIFTLEAVISGWAGSEKFYSKSARAEARANVYKLLFSATAHVPGIELGDGLVIPGGATQWFDGQHLTEMSPLGTPFIEASDLAGYGTIADEIKSTGGSYWATQYWRRFNAVCYFTDKAGNKHRSAPSPTVYAYNVIPNPNDWETITASFRIYPPLSMNPANTVYTMELYMSDDPSGPPKLAGTAEYRLDRTDDIRVAVSVSTGGKAATGPYDVNNTEPAVRFTPPVYTTGGVLPADTWPTLTMGVATTTRMWGLSAEDTGQVYYSKRFGEQLSPEFSAPLVLSLGDDRQLTAIGKLDDKIVVFERDAIHVIYGPGPDNTGTAGRGGGFDVHNIASPVGCSQPASLVETDNGLIFYSVRGFYLLDRSLKLHFIGAPAYDLAYNKTINTAVVIPEWAEVRFNIEDATTGFIPEYGFAKTVDTRFRPVETRHSRQLPLSSCLVYNYEFNRWTLFTGYRGLVSARTKSGRYAHIKSDWSIEVESRPEDDYYDSQMYIETTWIPVSDDMQGNARVRRATLLGKYLSSNNVNDDGVTVMNDLNVEVLYDYEEDSAVSTAAIQTESHDWRSNVELADYPYSVPRRMQVRFKPGRQKCQSMKFRIYDTVSEPYWITGPAGSWD